MIEMLEGVPGSGKSYHAVSTRFLAWVRANRKIYCYVDGIFLDKLAEFEGVDLETLKKQIIIWKTPEEVRAGLMLVESGSAIIIDEAQTIFRSKEKVDPELLRMLETHRHHGLDIVMMCQQYGQMTLGVIRLVEVTTKFRRLDRFGLKNRYQGQVRGNPEESEVIRMFSGKYSAKIYAYYASYSQAAIRETVRTGSILKSPMVILGLVGLVAAAAWFGFGNWLSGVAPVQAAMEVKLPPPPPLPVESMPVVEREISTPPLIVPVRIHGGLTVEREGVETWLWVSSDGRLMTEEEIAGESGGMVRSRMVRGVRVLSGTGVVYGGQGAEGRQGATSIVEYQPPVNSNVTGPVPEVYDTGRPNVFATPDLR